MHLSALCVKCPAAPCPATCRKDAAWAANRFDDERRFASALLFIAERIIIYCRNGMGTKMKKSQGSQKSRGSKAHTQLLSFLGKVLHQQMIVFIAHKFCFHEAAQVLMNAFG